VISPVLLHLLPRAHQPSEALQSKAREGEDVALGHGRGTRATRLRIPLVGIAGGGGGSGEQSSPFHAPLNTLPPAHPRPHVTFQSEPAVDSHHIPIITVDIILTMHSTSLGQTKATKMIHF
jgi:hypothetical protein